MLPSVDTCLWKRNSRKLSEDLHLNLPCCFPFCNFSWKLRYQKFWSVNCIVSGTWLKSAVNITDFWRMMAFHCYRCIAFRKRIKHLQCTCTGNHSRSQSIIIVFTFLCKRKNVPRHSLFSLDPVHSFFQFFAEEFSGTCLHAGES